MDGSGVLWLHPRHVGGLCPLHAPRKAPTVGPPAKALLPLETLHAPLPHTTFFFFSASLLLHFSESCN